MSFLAHPRFIRVVCRAGIENPIHHRNVRHTTGMLTIETFHGLRPPQHTWSVASRRSIFSALHSISRVRSFLVAFDQYLPTMIQLLRSPRRMNRHQLESWNVYLRRHRLAPSTNMYKPMEGKRDIAILQSVRCNSLLFQETVSCCKKRSVLSLWWPCVHVESWSWSLVRIVSLYTQILWPVSLASDLYRILRASGL